MSRADESAFATPSVTGLPNGHVEYGTPGLTVREHFAAMALMGFMANKDRPQYFNPKDDASYCVAVADELIAALEKPVTP